MKNKLLSLLTLLFAVSGLTNSYGQSIKLSVFTEQGENIFTWRSGVDLRSSSIYVSTDGKSYTSHAMFTSQEYVENIDINKTKYYYVVGVTETGKVDTSNIVKIPSIGVCPTSAGYEIQSAGIHFCTGISLSLSGGIVYGVSVATLSSVPKS